MDRRELEHLVSSLAGALKDVMPVGVGFALLVFDFGEGGFTAYASNAKRSEMIKALRECAGELEKHNG